MDYTFIKKSCPPGKQEEMGILRTENVLSEKLQRELKNDIAWFWYSMFIEHRCGYTASLKWEANLCSLDPHIIQYKFLLKIAFSKC